MHEIEYSYTVDAINDEGAVAQVTYTPADTRLKTVTRAVPVPLKKARDQVHAREIVRQKCRQRAPLNEWQEALELLEGRRSADLADTLGWVRENVVGQTERVEAPTPSREERIRREFLAGE